jgi:hypothetical protein
MPHKHTLRLGLTALALAWTFDRLFWGKTPGISFFIFIVLSLLAGALVSRQERARPLASSLVLLAPILFFASMTAMRLEPFTVLVCAGLSLAGLQLLSLTWLGGGWWRYTLSDLLYNTLHWTGLVLYKPAPALTQAWRGYRAASNAGDSEATPGGTELKGEPLREWSASTVLLGLLLALPVVAFLGVLLAEADPIFAGRLERLLRFLNLETLLELAWRGFYILVLAYLLSGALLYALLSSKGERVSQGGSSWISPFLAWPASLIVLGGVNLLYLFFVALQFQYFFGGDANIRIDGYTYAEYARRGFGELVVVAFISLALFLALSAVTRRKSRRARRIFSGAGVLLVGLVSVILVSAFQRLLLYEAAYGFSRLRTYTHVFMIWLGVLLLVTAALEASGRLRYFPLALVMTVIAFGASLALLNVDGFIVRQNVARAVRGEALDGAYLVSLSNDAVPALIESFEQERQPGTLRHQLGGVLSCRAALAEPAAQPEPWPSYHWSRARAARLMGEVEARLTEYPVTREDWVWTVEINGEEVDCLAPWDQPD